MTKSIWKVPFIDEFLLKNIIKKKKFIQTTSRSSIILKSFIGLTFFVHNGRNYKKLIITEDMIGHKLGEFAFTRKIGKIHNIKKKKRLISKKK